MKNKKEEKMIEIPVLFPCPQLEIQNTVACFVNLHFLTY